MWDPKQDQELSEKSDLDPKNIIPDPQQRLYTTSSFVWGITTKKIPSTVFQESSVADPWHFGVDPRIHAWLMDPDPDPAIFVIDLQDSSKKTSFLTKFFLLITFWSNIYIIFQR